MNNFVGIDLGTTNSAICSYDGSEPRIWKSPEQNDVTPSAIHFDRRGNKYVGQRAYDASPRSPDNCATLFKRFMGTSTPIELTAINRTMTPEECSAEVLKELFGYLPEEIRNDPDIGTVITVPAAFDQMQKEATMEAATLAGIGKVALMQEPVAAVMSAMRARDTDGMFLIYDLGGGTLDIAIAESIGGRVSLLEHGGIVMCGGRDFDRVLVDNIVRPWLFENFDMPDDLSVNPTFKPLLRSATRATERAKIELSARDEAAIFLLETETGGVRDLNGDEMYLDIPLQRDTYDSLIAEHINETINCARETLSKAGLTPHDLERIVWVGGPTHYKPLRDRVAFELGIPGGNIDVNPMTAVAEGASLFAESIDWSSQNRSRKDSRGQISSEDITFNYIARTPTGTAKIAVQIKGEVIPGSEFQIDSVDSGWTSGHLPLKDGTTIDVTLTRNGENTFSVLVFDSLGGPIALEDNTIVITRTAATIDAIPASHSVALIVLDKLGGRQTLEYIVKQGDQLPKEGRTMLKAAESLEAGTHHSLNFELRDVKEDSMDATNRIGVMEIKGDDFDEGVIPVGADLVCDYVMQDSGLINLEVSVPCIGGTFHSDRNFYLPQEGHIDYTSASVQVAEAAEQTLNRIDEISGVAIGNPKLEQARQKLASAAALSPEEADAERIKREDEKVQDAKVLLVQVRKEHLKEIRQIELSGVISFFEEYIRQYARPLEISAFHNLTETAQQSIDNNDNDFEDHLAELRGRNFDILWRQDWYVIQRFKQMVEAPHLFADKHRFEELANTGMQLIHSYDSKVESLTPEQRGNFAPIEAFDDIEQLRDVIVQMWGIQVDDRSDYNEMVDVVTNIMA